MIETVQWRRWVTKNRTRQPATPQAQGGDFTVILMLSLSGLALSFFAIRLGWVGDADYLTSLFLLLQ